MTWILESRLCARTRRMHPRARNPPSVPPPSIRASCKSFIRQRADTRSKQQRSTRPRALVAGAAVDVTRKVGATRGVLFRPQISSPSEEDRCWLKWILVNVKCPILFHHGTLNQETTFVPKSSFLRLEIHWNSTKLRWQHPVWRQLKLTDLVIDFS